MVKMYKVTVKGTGQLNGPVKINKTVEMEQQMAIKFNGANRYDVIAAFVAANYPGVQINNIRDFGASVILIPEKKIIKEKALEEDLSSNSKSSIKSNNKVKSGTKSSLFAGIVSSIKEEFIEDHNDNSTNIQIEKPIHQIEEKVEQIININFSSDPQTLQYQLERL